MPAPAPATAGDVTSWAVEIEISHWWVVVIFALLAALVLLWSWRRRAGGKRWYLWPLPLVILPLLLGACAWVNIHFGLYNRLGDLFDSYTFATGSESLLAEPTGTHPTGVAVTTLIPSTADGVDERPAFIWLPPQYFTAPAGTKFPVVYLYHGSPGDYTNWFVGGFAAEAALASAQAGHPAIVVSPSVLPTPFADTECVNGSQGNWQDYLAIDVPNFVQRNTHALSGPGTQGVAGLSMGGYCAQITALRNPDMFHVSGNFSGSTMPTYDGGMTALFGNPPDLTAAVDSYTSSWVIANQPQSRSVATWCRIGADDDAGLIADEQGYTDQAAALGMNAQFALVPGTHTFYVWSQDLRDWLSWALPQLRPAGIEAGAEGDPQEE